MYTVDNLDGNVKDIDLDTLHRMRPIIPENKCIYKDCPYDTCILIVCSYVDDNLAFTTSRLLADAFSAHCNKRMTMT